MKTKDDSFTKRQYPQRCSEVMFIRTQYTVKHILTFHSFAVNQKLIAHNIKIFTTHIQI